MQILDLLKVEGGKYLVRYDPGEGQEITEEFVNESVVLKYATRDQLITVVTEKNKVIRALADKLTAIRQKLREEKLNNKYVKDE